MSAISVNVKAVEQPVPTVGESVTWEEYEWGGLASSVLSNGVEISGAYDGADTTPLTGGFNNYFLLSNEVFADALTFSCDITVPEFQGTEAIVGIGIRAPSEMDFCYRDSVLWCWYYYSSAGANSIGWLHECLGDVYERTTIDDTDLTLGRSYEYKMVVEDGVLSLFIDGECKASESNPLSEFNIFLEVAIKYSGTYIDAVFEDILVQRYCSSPRSPIYIDGNEDLTVENGVVNGSGTEDDPFIIENWVIQDCDEVAMLIRFTDAYLVVRNVVISGALGGIYLYKVENVVIENVILYSNEDAGSYLNTVRNCRVQNSYVHNNGHEGIIFRYSENVTVSGNLIEWNDWEGVMVEYSQNVTINDNRIVGNGFLPNPSIVEYLGYGGVYIVSASECEISRNWIGQNVEGVCAFMSDHLLVIANYGISDNVIGIALEDCTLSQVYWNNMLNNSLQAEDIWTTDLGKKNANRWDNGIEGGNYWSDQVKSGTYKFVDNVDRHPLSDPI